MKSLRFFGEEVRRVWFLSLDQISVWILNEIARIANLSIKKGYQIQDEKRLLTKEEAYEQISHSASLFKAILRYVEKID